MTRLCAVEGCGKPFRAKTFCWRHYERFKTYGDPLKGGTSHGELLRYVEDTVLTYTGSDCLEWPFGRISTGYGSLRADGKQQVASRYICQRVHGDPPTPEHEAAHSCGNGHLGCVTKGHLSWKTRVENQADRLIHGTDARGEKCWLAKLNTEDVKQIRAMQGVETQAALAEEFGVDQSNICHIQKGRSWNHTMEGQ